MTKQLIYPQEVLEFAFVPDDPITTSLVRPACIEIAQLRHIRPTFGEAMYQRMRTTSDYDEFVSRYIKIALAHYVRCEMIGELAVRVGDYGVVRPSAERSEQTSSATKSDLHTTADDNTLRVTRHQVKQTDVNDANTKTTITVNDTVKESTELIVGMAIDEQSTKDVNDGSVVISSVSLKPTPTAPSSVLTESQSSENIDNTQQITDTVSKENEESKRISYADVISEKEDVSGTATSLISDSTESADSTVTTAEGTKTMASEDAGVGNTSRTRFEVATAQECKDLASQAFRDATVLLRYAIDYVEANAAQFPDYKPLTGRRCVGGIVM